MQLQPVLGIQVTAFALARIVVQSNILGMAGPAIVDILVIVVDRLPVARIGMAQGALARVMILRAGIDQRQVGSPGCIDWPGFRELAGFWQVFEVAG